ncbi:MAG: DVU0298 family protein [Candidatus Zixiibacteriota bacterium]
MATGFRQKKQLAREMLSVYDKERIDKWLETEQSVFRILVSMLFDAEKVICYRAAELLGKAAAIEAHRNPENVKELLRRLLWSMNDESGNICWYAPEAIGEILYNVPDLCREFCPLLASFLSEEPFEKGTRLAIARIACIKREIFHDVVGRLVESLQSKNPQIRGASLLALVSVDPRIAADMALSLENDNDFFEVYEYETGNLGKIRISDFARKIT